MARTQRRHRRKFTMVNPDAAGIDIGSRFHVVAVPTGRGEIRTFNTFTGDLYRLADWLDEVGIKTVAMESTGVYWIPLYEILEARGFEVLLVNARHVKHVPGRKSDVHDAQWLQQLHQFGLLTSSFRPHERLLALRTYLRERDMLVSRMTTHVQHMHKALTQMNLQIQHVIADMTGVTGMAIVRAILAGERDPEVLAQHRDRRCKASEDTIREALVGNYRAEHVFSLQLAFDLHQFHQRKLEACDSKIQHALDTLRADVAAPDQPMPAGGRESKQANAPKFPVRNALYALLGVDLTQISGLGAYSALKLIGECGTDMNAWHSAKHFTSWLTLAPGSKKSGGKVLSSKTRTSSNRAAAMFRMAAMAASRSDTALGAFYRRLAARKGKPAAITATARKIAVLFYNMLRHGTAYHDPGADAYDQQHRQRVLRNLKRRAQSLGYELKPATDEDSAMSTA
jgi:transposase